MAELPPPEEERRTSSDGSKGTGLAIAGVLVAVFAALPFVVLATLYLFVTVYAIVRAVGPGTGEDPAVIVVGFVLLTSVLAVAIGVAVHLIGRSLTPRKRRAKT